MVQQILGYVRMGKYGEARQLICGLYDYELPILIREAVFQQLEEGLKLCLKAKDCKWISEVLK